MNKYQEALENLKVPTDDWESAELQLAENNDEPIEYKEQESIDLLQELVDKVTPKKVIKLPEKDRGYEHICPRCEQFVGTIVFEKHRDMYEHSCIEEDDYCCSCGQRLDWEE